jgi:hypothetical protein
LELLFRVVASQAGRKEPQNSGGEIYKSKIKKEKRKMERHMRMRMKMRAATYRHDIIYTSTTHPHTSTYVQTSNQDNRKARKKQSTGMRKEERRENR